MAEFILMTAEQIEHSENARVVALWAVTALLAIVFLAMLVGDQVQASSF